MNFAAHFFLDLDRPESLFHIGAATPDLLSIYNPEMRIKESHLKNIDFDSLGPPEETFIAGIHRHFHADKVFHSSGFFRQETTEIIERLKNSFEEGAVPRKFFIGHILLELLLDKVLIDTHPNMLGAYYEHFAKVSPLEVRRVTEIAVSRELPNYEHFIAKFIGNQYLYEYMEFDHIVFVVGRILRRVSIDQIGFLSDPTFVNLMKNYEERLEANYPGIFELIRKEGEKES